jgi:hypothetical protein
MSWEFSQRRNTLGLEGDYRGLGRSGDSDPDKEDIAGGPAPRGSWLIGTWSDSDDLGQCTAPITPAGHDAHGRSGFAIVDQQDPQLAAEVAGSLALPLALRQAMRDSGITDLIITG